MLWERIFQARCNNLRNNKEPDRFDKIDYKSWFEKKSANYDERTNNRIFLKHM